MTSSPSPPTPTLVNIGTHNLCLYNEGPEPASPKSPVVLLVPGLGTSTLVWAAVRRLLPSIRVYSYDRSGYRKSEHSPRPPTAENIALELSLLIQNARIENPLILVVASWGGVIAREFVALTGNGPHIAGLVLVDANHERTLQVLDWTNSDLQAVFQGIDSLSARCLGGKHKLTPEEWDAYESDEATERHLLQEAKENIEYPPSFETLRKKGLGERDQPLLGDKPVFVIMGFTARDWEGQYTIGVGKGNGTEEQRRVAREMIDSANEKNEILQMEHLALSRNSKFRFAKESGHFIQLTEPEVVADGVKWVLRNYQSS
jgi:pimeloyl-ACP methyl ester carboxylesterase